jgi:AraC family cel operon transcriptional repressor
LSYIDWVQRLRFDDFVPEHDHCHFQHSWITPQRQAAPHVHDFHELFWVDGGHGWHWIGGERKSLTAGSAALIQPSDEHAFEIDIDKSLLLTNVAFRSTTWREVERRYTLGAGLFNLPLSERQVSLGANDVSELALACQEIARGARDRRAVDRFLLNAFHVFERARGTGYPPGVPDWLLEACRAVRAHKNLQKGTAAFAALCGHSPEHVAREVRRWLGKTPTDVVNEARLDHAASRLAESDTPIVEVALACGYENISHFYRLFRERYGVSPGRYRERQQQLVVPPAAR